MAILSILFKKKKMKIESDRVNCYISLPQKKSR